MSTPLPAHHRRQAGMSAIVAGALLFASVVGEIVRPVQRPDGTVTDTGLFVSYVGLFGVGTAALVYSLTRLASLHRASQGNLGRSGNVGIWISVAGAVLLTAYALTVGTTGISEGAPLEASFVLFGLGFLLLVIGQIPLALALRKTRMLGVFWLAPLAAAIGALIAVVVFTDPWHDLGLFVFDASWIALGARLITRASGAAPSGP